jgi:hypothetical protein
MYLDRLKPLFITGNHLMGELDLVCMVNNS